MGYMKRLAQQRAEEQSAIHPVPGPADDCAFAYKYAGETFRLDRCCNCRGRKFTLAFTVGNSKCTTLAVCVRCGVRKVISLDQAHAALARRIQKKERKNRNCRRRARSNASQSDPSKAPGLNDTTNDAGNDATKPGGGS